MTEEEWLEHDDPVEMLDFLDGKISERKGRLFAVACCHAVWDLLTESQRICIEKSEQFADGKATVADLESARKVVDWFAAGMPFRPAYRVIQDFPLKQEPSRFQDLIREAVRFASQLQFHFPPSGLHEFGDALNPARETVRAIGTAVAVRASETPGSYETWLTELRSTIHKFKSRQVSLVRDIFNNPFCPISLDPDLLNENVLAIAEAIYEERSFEEIPVLADALEEAGCTDEEILEHCRDGKEHVLGCWVVDSILGKK